MLQRLTVIVMLLITVTLGLAVFAATRLDDYVNNNKEDISARVSQSLGRTFTFEHAGLSLRGGLGARLNGVQIADDPAYSSGSFVAAESVTVQVKLMPLLRRRVEVSGVALVKPLLELVQTRQGLNVSTLGPANAAPSESVPPSSTSPGAAAVAVALFNIESGTVRYTDKTVSPPSVLTVENLNVKASDIDVTRPMSFVMTAAVLGAATDNLRAEGTFGPVNVAAPATSPLTATIDLSDLTTDALSRAPNIAAMLPEGLRVKGPIDMTLGVQGSSSKADLTAVFEASRADVAYAGAFAKPVGVPFKFNAKAVRTQQAVNITESALVLNKAVINTTGTLTTSGETTLYDLVMRAADVDLKGWDKLIAALAGTDVSGRGGIDLRAKGASGSSTPPQITGTVSVKSMRATGAGRPALEDLTTTIKLNGNAAVLPPTEFKIGGSAVRVQADIADLKTMATKFSLTADTFDPAGFGMDDQNPKTTETLTGLSVNGSAVISPELAVDAMVTAASGNLRGAAFRDLRATLGYSKGKATFKPVQMLAFGGRLEGTASYTSVAKGGPPTFEFDGKVREVRLPEVFAYTGVPSSEQFLDGLLDAEFAVWGKGDRWDVIRSALTGNGRLAVRQGALKDFNLAEAVLGGLTGVPGISNTLSPSLRSKYPSLFGSKSTAFKDLRSGIKIVDGVLRSEEFTLNADDFGLRGQGGYGLDRSVNFDAVFLASQQLSADLLAESSVLKYLTNQSGRLEIPFDLRGTAPNVRARIDSAFVGRAIEKAAAGAVTDLLGGLLGGRRKQEAPQAAPSQPAQPAPRQAPDAGGL